MYKKYYYVSVLKIIYLIIIFIIALNPDEESLFSKNEYLFVVILNAIFIFFLAEKLHKIKFQTFIQYLQLKLYKYKNKLKWLTVSLNHLIFIVFLFLSSAVSLFAYFSFKLGLSVVFPKYSDNSDGHTNVIIFSIFLVGLSLALLYLILIFFNVFTDDVILCKTEGFRNNKELQETIKLELIKKKSDSVLFGKLGVSSGIKNNNQLKLFLRAFIVIFILSSLIIICFYFINNSKFNGKVNGRYSQSLIKYNKEVTKYNSEYNQYQVDLAKFRNDSLSYEQNKNKYIEVLKRKSEYEDRLAKVIKNIERKYYNYIDYDELQRRENNIVLNPRNNLYLPNKHLYNDEELRFLNEIEDYKKHHPSPNFDVPYRPIKPIFNLDSPIKPSFNDIKREYLVKTENSFWRINLLRYPKYNILPLFLMSFFYLFSIFVLILSISRLYNEIKIYNRLYSKEFFILSILSSVILSFIISNYISRFYYYYDFTYLFANTYTYLVLFVVLFFLFVKFIPKIHSFVKKNNSLILSNKGINRIFALIWLGTSAVFEIVEVLYDERYYTVREMFIRESHYYNSDDVERVRYKLVGGLILFLTIPIIYFIISWIVNGFKENKMKNK